MSTRLPDGFRVALKFSALGLLVLTCWGTARWSQRTEGAWGPLHRAARAGDAEAVWKLVSTGCDVNATDLTGGTPLHAAALSGDLDSIDLLLECGADLNAVDFDGETPLSLAVRLKHEEAARLLLDRGADASRCTTVLHLAAFGDEISLVEPLLDHGADPRTLDSSGRSALSVAVAEGHGNFARELLRCVRAHDCRLQL